VSVGHAGVGRWKGGGACRCSTALHSLIEGESRKVGGKLSWPGLGAEGQK
jgi:hypothetical protein